MNKTFLEQRLTARLATGDFSVAQAIQVAHASGLRNLADRLRTEAGLARKGTALTAEETARRRAVLSGDMAA